MALPYQLYGGATRPDALNFNEAFNTALLSLYQSAPPEVQRELGLTSGFRSNATQQRLFNASDKSGKMVARPGHSKHESGTAADLYGFGLGGGKGVSETTRNWVHQNAKAHGLYFPMSYEPWHIQLAGDGTPAAAGPEGSGMGQVMAGAMDPRAAIMAELENNPWKTVSDAAPKRGGLVGEGSAGALTPDSDPGIPLLETASATVTPDTLAAPASPMAPTNVLPQLADLFKGRVKPIGQAAAQARPQQPRRTF